jgi:tetratricopeptide (TPR) repeat protein
MRFQLAFRRRVPGWRAIAAVALPCILLYAPTATAQDADTSNNDAGRHFRRGVDLYSEADYAGALVEFKRAYALTPSSAALYNVGEAQYQLQDYASALKTFRRFLAEFGSNESHRAEVERAVDVLRLRVGHVNITTAPAGADVSVDDQPVGRTPLGEPVLVSVGRRKVVASMAGRPPVTRYLDVAAGDDLEVTLPLAAPFEGTSAPPSSEQTPAQSAAPSHPWDASRLKTVGWIATGTLAAGAAVFGVLAVGEARDLKNARDAFPGSSATLNHDANLTATYSVLADSLAAAAIVAGGLSLYWTLSSSSSTSRSHGSVPATRVTFGLASARVDMTF